MQFVERWNAPPERQQHGVKLQSELISTDVERPMKNAQYVDAFMIVHQIGDAIVAVEEDSYMSARCPVAMADFRKASQHLRPLKDAVDGLSCRLGVI